jgi:hypothetical protein
MEVLIVFSSRSAFHHSRNFFGLFQFGMDQKLWLIKDDQRLTFLVFSEVGKNAQSISSREPSTFLPILGYGNDWVQVSFLKSHGIAFNNSWWMIKQRNSENQNFLYSLGKWRFMIPNVSADHVQMFFSKLAMSVIATNNISSQSMLFANILMKRKCLTFLVPLIYH